ncbi:MAG: GNAT family N-acetyltransferase, partial [Flavobacteriaceae bacterium]|nr:GNAT family N-acetyltransferase [Flavobacteriaceae bacterium]
MISVEEIKAEETFPIRKEILRKNMDLSSQFTGDFDKESFHLGLFYKNELVSIVSFMKTKHHMLNGEQYQLRGMATIEKFQGKGFGKILVEKSEEILTNKNINYVWCNARVLALNFY